MKKIFLFFALIVGGFSTVATAADTFDPATNTLTLDSVTVGGIKYPTVVVRLNQFTVLGVGNSAPVENGISETCEAENFTEDKFGAIQEGMSIEQITQIIGCKDEERRLYDGWIAADWTAPQVYTFAVSFIEPTPTKFIVEQSSSGRVRKIRVNLGGTLSPIGTTGTTNNAFDPATNVLTMDSVWVTGGLKYENVAVHLDQFTVLGVAGETVVPPSPPPPPITPPPPPPPVTPPPPIVSSTCSPANFTIDKYNAIQVGISLDQVNQIIGCEANDIVRQGSLVTYSWNYVSGGTAKLIMVFFDQSSLNVTGSMEDFFKSSAGF